QALKQTMSSSRPNQPGKSGAAASSSSSSKSTKTVAKRGAAGPAAGRGRGLPTDGQGNLIPGRYQLPGGELRVNKIQRAEQYNVLAVAKAMNGAELAPKVKQLFEPEMRAVEEAKASGWYFSWRPRSRPTTSRTASASTPAPAASAATTSPSTSSLAAGPPAAVSALQMRQLRMGANQTGGGRRVLVETASRFRSGQLAGKVPVQTHARGA
ncbi:hypothetical protein BOX15_Mlig019563g2, partial [Macrostomum lignano]